MPFINIADLKDPNDPQGRSYREINHAKQHTIPIGSLVEVATFEHEDPADFGQRLFVTRHTRDCDGTPLYTLSCKRQKSGKDHRATLNFGWNGLPEYSLLVIRLPDPETSGD